MWVMLYSAFGCIITSSTSFPRQLSSTMFFAPLPQTLLPGTQSPFGKPSFQLIWALSLLPVPTALPSTSALLIPPPPPRAFRGRGSSLEGCVLSAGPSPTTCAGPFWLKPKRPDSCVGALFPPRRPLVSVQPKRHGQAALCIVSAVVFDLPATAVQALLPFGRWSVARAGEDKPRPPLALKGLAMAEVGGAAAP